MTRPAFFDAFKRFEVAWCAQLLSVLTKTITWVEIPELQSLGKLYCIDDYIFPALAKLHLLFSLNQMIPVQFVVGSGQSTERAALRQMLEAGVTYLADRGYVSFALIADIVAAQAPFVFWMKANLSYTFRDKLTRDLT